MRNSISRERSRGLAVFTYDDGTRKLQISPDYAGIYGLSEGTLEISSEDWRALVHPDDLPRLDAIIDRAFSNGETEVHPKISPSSATGR